MSRLALPVFVLLMIAASQVISLPRFATEQGLPCGQCHLNPNGGGMRNEFGNHAVALNELTLQSTKKHVIEKYKSPRLAESLSFGFDMRYLMLEDLSAFRMQSDVYLAAEPLEDLFYHVRFWREGISEQYALLKFAEDRGYIKAGRFRPTFGLHNEDHNSFVRSITGHGPGMYLDGVSAGARISDVSVAVELLDQGGRGVYGLHVYRTGYIAPFSYLAGASVQLSEEINGSNGAYPHAKGIFGGLSLGRFTALAEADMIGQGNDSLTTYASLTARVIYGLYLVGEYNFFDADRDVKQGTEESVRVSAEFFPIPFVQLRPSYTYYTEGVRKSEDELFVQFHFGY